MPFRMTQVFELQTQAIPLEGPGRAVPPEKPTATWRQDFLARQKVAGKKTPLTLDLSGRIHGRLCTIGPALQGWACSMCSASLGLRHA